MKIYIDGKDGIGWSIDKDRQLLISSIKRLGLIPTTKYYQADIVHNIWWNSLLEYRKFLIRFKTNILVTTSNFVNLDDENYVLKDTFYKVNEIAKAWIVPSTKQKDIFDRHGVRSYYQPFSIDLNLFSPLKERFSKKELLHQYNIPEDVVKNKLIIGSFQRDSLGSNIKKPKWQKGPELLIELLKDLPKDKFILLLAGPRRHFVISQCKKYNIPYFFVGKESLEDDIKQNSLEISQMSGLYALLDIYLVTSLSEGGPKAVLESVATKTFIMSTDVGLARDFINNEFIFSNPTEYKNALFSFIENNYSYRIFHKTIIEKQYKKVIKVIGNEAMDCRLFEIYQAVLNNKK
jgi:glycosyltransferase involved in cell wall biosynthesis